MKRWIVYLLIVLTTAAGLPTATQAADRDRDKSPNSSTLKMNARKLSKRTAKMRKTKARDRKKQMAYIKKSNQQRNKQMNKKNK